MDNYAGFIIKEGDFSGIDRLADNVRQDNAQKQAQLAAGERQKEAKQSSAFKLLNDITDDKKFLSGLPQDRYITGNLAGIYEEGIQLIGKGYSDIQLGALLNNRLSKLSEDSQRLKLLKQQKDETVAALSKNPAIDIEKFNSEWNNLYYETDEKGNKKIKDIQNLDPSKNYANEILNTKSIYNDLGFDEYLSKAEVLGDRKSMTVRDGSGKVTKKDMDLKAPSFMEPEYDKDGVFTRKFIPKHDVAMDDDKPIIAKFLNEETGKEVDAEVYLLDNGVFMDLPAGALAYVRQEARQFAEENGMPINDKRVEFFARALAYDKVKNSSKFKTDINDIQVQQQPLPPRTTINNNISSKDEGVTYNDTYGVIEDYVSSTQKNGVGAAFNGLPLDAQNVVLEFVNKGKGEKTKRTESDIYLREEGGKIYIMDATKKPKEGQRPPSDAYLGILPKGATNVKTTQGVKGKIEAQEAGKTQPSATNPQTLAERMKAAANKPK